MTFTEKMDDVFARSPALTVLFLLTMLDILVSFFWDSDTRMVGHVYLFVGLFLFFIAPFTVVVWVISRLAGASGHRAPRRHLDLRAYPLKSEPIQDAEFREVGSKSRDR